MAPETFSLHPDRLLPADPSLRPIARELYQAVAQLPIFSPHGHVPAQWLAENQPFEDPTSLLITPDHYINRLLHAEGVDLADLGVGRGADFGPQERREAFRIFCRHWKAYRGTPVRFWFESELAEVFDIDLVPSEANADALYDAIAERLTTAQFRPRALFDRFRIEFLATTDDPCDTLEHHKALLQDPTWHGTLAPTFRPDKYLEPAAEGWNALVDRLGEVSGQDVGTYAGFTAAMENRRAFFAEHGCVSTDHSHRDPGMIRLDTREAEALYAAARAGSIGAEDGARLRRAMMFEQVRMATEDGLAMTLHPGVFRNTDTATFGAFGADVGNDIPLQVEYVRSIQPALDAFGNHPNLRLIPITIDETVYSRELAPLAGWYRSVFVGPPWWFIDEVEAIKRFRRAVTGTAGFGRTAGFIDDTRAFCSIPARHDMNRRLDCAWLAELVADHRLTMDEALDTAVDLVVTQPRKAFGIA